MFAMPTAIPGQNNAVSTHGSKMLGLGLIGDDQTPQSVTNSPNPFYFAIPRDTSQPRPQFDLLEITDHQESSNYTISASTANINDKALNMLKLNGFITPKNNVSIHYHVRPNSENFESVGYFAAIKFGGNTYLNSSYQSFDIWKIFCPQSMTLPIKLLISIDNYSFFC